MDTENVCVCVCVNTHTHTHTQNGMLLSHKKIMEYTVLPFAATWMDLEIILSKVKSEKDKYYIVESKK